MSDGWSLTKEWVRNTRRLGSWWFASGGRVALTVIAALVFAVMWPGTAIDIVVLAMTVAFFLVMIAVIIGVPIWLYRSARGLLPSERAAAKARRDAAERSLIASSTEYWKQYMAQDRRMTPQERLERDIAVARATATHARDLHPQDARPLD